MADTQHATNTFPPGFTVITRKIDDIRCLVRVGSSGIFLPAPIRHHLGDPRRVVVAANGGTSFALAPAGEDTPLTVSFSLSIGGLIQRTTALTRGLDGIRNGRYPPTLHDGYVVVHATFEDGQ